MKFKNIVSQMISLDQFKIMEAYFELVEAENAKYNLTGFQGDALWENAIYQSIVGLDKLVKDDSTLADIGAGAGFPSIPLLIIKPKLKLTIFEPMKKRVNFLNLVKEKLNLDFQINAQRIELINLNENQRFDFVTARAVMPLKQLIEATIQIAKISGEYIFFKGLNLDQEIEEAKNSIKLFEINPEIKKINSESEMAITLFSYSKNKQVSNKYPREWSKIKNSPL
ncbi:16S rRNA (guanine527-N7)-methyltransferase [Mycoplasma testudineum]|uniref:Ribosomal RNA small subunit methyltransferase G n=1 Tax=Mycoplasma testudineum TaxID=244584 RepID=A0A4V3C315_9MOLU|nr:16S rRNA (guanine(527)-N(7))-methyltransferase RsmG [Mycoplasma testudineum]OYD26844.1 16S rRNA (guanine(527)-N(7))-methyltransferase RsmG [Mycoplasma testudineum]TDO20379.1 16S rRNA (guanine527-N7)-methyltransferase [Mycoplasma testudineum]